VGVEALLIMDTIVHALRMKMRILLNMDKHDIGGTKTETGGGTKVQDIAGLEVTVVVKTLGVTVLRLEIGPPEPERDPWKRVEVGAGAERGGAQVAVTAETVTVATLGTEGRLEILEMLEILEELGTEVPTITADNTAGARVGGEGTDTVGVEVTVGTGGL
jgi:hypothetical protein